MEVVLNILGDLVLFCSVALLLWGMVLCATLQSTAPVPRTTRNESTTRRSRV